MSLPQLVGVWEDVSFGIVLVAGHKMEEPVVMHTQQMNPLYHARRCLTSLGDRAAFALNPQQHA